MANPYIGEIRIFAGNFAPTGWALCNGQLLAISQNTALFSLLGTQYGGDGKTTFALPNLQGNAPMHQGSGAGLTPRVVGELSGSQNVTLIQTEIPAHTHTTFGCGAGAKATNNTPANEVLADEKVGTFQTYATAADNATFMNTLSTLQGLPHENMQPYLTLNFIIALQGVFPPRS